MSGAPLKYIVTESALVKTLFDSLDTEKKGFLLRADFKRRGSFFHFIWSGDIDNLYNKLDHGRHSNKISIEDIYGFFYGVAFVNFSKIDVDKNNLIDGVELDTMVEMFCSTEATPDDCKQFISQLPCYHGDRRLTFHDFFLFILQRSLKALSGNFDEGLAEIFHHASTVINDVCDIGRSEMSPEVNYFSSMKPSSDLLDSVISQLGVNKSGQQQPTSPFIETQHQAQQLINLEDDVNALTEDLMKEELRIKCMDLEENIKIQTEVIEKKIIENQKLRNDFDATYSALKLSNTATDQERLRLSNENLLLKKEMERISELLGSTKSNSIEPEPSVDSVKHDQRTVPGIIVNPMDDPSLPLIYWGNLAYVVTWAIIVVGIGILKIKQTD